MDITGGGFFTHLIAGVPGVLPARDLAAVPDPVLRAAAVERTARSRGTGRLPVVAAGVLGFLSVAGALTVALIPTSTRPSAARAPRTAASSSRSTRSPSPRRRPGSAVTVSLAAAADARSAHLLRRPSLTCGRRRRLPPRRPAPRRRATTPASSSARRTPPAIRSPTRRRAGPGCTGSPSALPRSGRSSRATTCSSAGRCGSRFPDDPDPLGWPGARQTSSASSRSCCSSSCSSSCCPRSCTRRSRRA